MSVRHLKIDSPAQRRSKKRTAPPIERRPNRLGFVEPIFLDEPFAVIDGQHRISAIREFLKRAERD